MTVRWASCPSCSSHPRPDRRRPRRPRSRPRSMPEISLQKDAKPDSPFPLRARQYGTRHEKPDPRSSQKSGRVSPSPKGAAVWRCAELSGPVTTYSCDTCPVEGPSCLETPRDRIIGQNRRARRRERGRERSGDARRQGGGRAPHAPQAARASADGPEEEARPARQALRAGSRRVERTRHAPRRMPKENPARGGVFVCLMSAVASPC